MPAMTLRSLTCALAAFAMLAVACGTTEPAPAATASADADPNAAPSTTLQPTTAIAPSQTTTSLSPNPTTSATIEEIPLAVIPASYEEYRNQPTACGAEQPPQVVEQSFAAPEDMAVATLVTATIATSCGDIVLELDAETAPETVNSFVFLATQGYFDGTVSHRIFPGFVIQAGDPTGTGRGGPGYVISDEFPAADFAYERGVLAMANAGPGTTGSQFFVMLGEAPLPPQFSVFGRVVGGLDVLDAIAALPLAANPFGEVSVPLETLYLESVTVEGFAD